ncbi:MAG: LysR family transcriptional regulator [Angelakisella sp.]|nr:LysR family transcriptional regulator [Angelakisella sp.]
MQIKAFQYFDTIVEKKTLSAAAEALFISQPALSQQLRKMEEEVGAQLFLREGHSLVLTPAGEIFLKNSRHMLRVYGNMRREIDLCRRKDRGSVRFGISPFYSQHYLPRLLPPILHQHPHLKIDIVEDISQRLERLLLEGELDFCALPLSPKNELLEYEAIYQEEILLAVPRSHPLNAGYPATALSEGNFPYIDLALVKNEAFIGLKQVQKFSVMGLRLCEEAGFVPNTICETLNWETVHLLVASGLGVGFIPRMLAGEVKDLAACPCYYRIPASFRAYAIARRLGESPSDPALILIDGIRDFFRTM